MRLLDALRGFAVLGILGRNVFVFGMPFYAYAIPGFGFSDGDSDRMVTVFVSVFLEGTMRALLSIVFGASALLILTVGTDPLAAADRYFRRALALIGLGLAHGYLLLWPHDILFMYGVIALLLFPFRRLSARALAVIGFVLLVGSTVIEGSGWRDVGSAVTEIATSPDGKAELPVPDARVVLLSDTLKDVPDDDQTTADILNAISDEVEARSRGYAENFRALASETLEQQSTELLTHHVLDIGSMIFIGMALFRAGVLSGTASRTLYRRLAGGGLVLGIVLGVLAHDALIGIEPLMPLSDAIGDYLFEVRRLAFALAIVGSFGLLAKRRGSTIIAALAAPGRMALTLYVMQTALCIWVFYGFGMDLFGAMTHAELLGFAFAVSAGQLVLAHIWLARFDAGPLEAVLKRVVSASASRTASPMRSPSDVVPG